jgi:hypothetical protein
MAVYIVDWDDFQEKVRQAEAYEVLEQLRPEPLEDEGAKAPMSFMEAFDAFYRAWKSDERLYLKEVFDTLFWSWRGGSAERVMELEEGRTATCSGSIPPSSPRPSRSWRRWPAGWTSSTVGRTSGST